MTTADPIALPEPKFGEWLRGIYASEKNPHRDGMYVRTILRDGRFNPGKYYEVTDGKGDFWSYLAESTTRVPATDALTPAPQVPEGMTVNAERYLHLRNIAHPDSESGLAVSFLSQNDWGKWCSEYPTGEELDRMVDAERSATPSTPPLNEVLGQPEEFNLNEVSGDSGQLASLEQRARELLAAEYERDAHSMLSLTYAKRLRASDRCEPWAFELRAITAALSAQPRGVLSEAVAEPGAIRALVTAANAVLALYPADDGMWTLEQAVRPFNEAKPGECENGCPDNQVCDYCQFAAPQPREVLS